LARRSTSLNSLIAFLAKEQEDTAPVRGSTALPVGFKLVLQPVVTWVPATIVFGPCRCSPQLVLI